MVVLHLDEATDSKSLLGSYTCGDTPGEFRWQPGVLAQAVSAGRWLVLEDVDAAPPEVLAALLPLLEGQPLPVPGRESLTPAPGFALFGSVSANAGARRELVSAALWSRVHIAAPPADEVAQILFTVFSEGAPLVPAMLESLTAVHALCTRGSETSKSLVRLGRDLTLRDAVKWARRMLTMHRAQLNAPGTMPLRLRELAFLEGLDVLAGVLPSGASRESVIAAMAAVWSLPADWAVHSDTQRTPDVSAADGVLHVGRAWLELHATSSAGLGGGYALTGHALRILERLAVAVTCCEAVLLVGETGTGKTAAVQALARAAGARLVVVNLSTQSDSADLLGSFKPREAGTLCYPLVATFLQLFAETFPREPNSEFATRVVRARGLARIHAARRAPLPISIWPPIIGARVCGKAHTRTVAQLDLRSLAVGLLVPRSRHQKPLIWFRSHTACPQAKYAERQKWSRLLQAIKLAAERVEKLAAGINQADTRDVGTADAPDVEQATAPSTKRRRMLPDGALNAWRALHAQAHAVENQVRC